MKGDIIGLIMVLGVDGKNVVGGEHGYHLDGPGAPVEAAPTGIHSEAHHLDNRAFLDRISEALVEQLFIANGYAVFRYGLNVAAAGMSASSGVVRDQGMRMPGLVALRDHDTINLEVRFVPTGEFGRGDLPADYPYDEAYVIVISREHIKCASVAELNAGLRITSASRELFERREELGLSEGIVDELAHLTTLLFRFV